MPIHKMSQSEDLSTTPLTYHAALLCPLMARVEQRSQATLSDTQNHVILRAILSVASQYLDFLESLESCRRS